MLTVNMDEGYTGLFCVILFTSLKAEINLQTKKVKKTNKTIKGECSVTGL